MEIFDNNITKSLLPREISSIDQNLNQEHSPEYKNQQYLFCLTDVGLNFFFFSTSPFEEKLEGYLSKQIENIGHNDNSREHVLPLGSAMKNA